MISPLAARPALDTPATRLSVRSRLLRRLIVWIVTLAGLLALVIVIAAAHGPARVSYQSTASVILSRIGVSLGSASPAEQRIVEQIRLPRITVALIVGAALATAGAALQAVFRNPLADPGIIGVSSGAALGAVTVIGLHLTQIPLVLPAAAFLGAVAATGAVTLLATAGGRMSAATLILAGLAIQSFCGAAVAAVVTTTSDSDLIRNMLFWLSGGLDSRSWTHVGIALPFVGLALAGLLAYSRDLNILGQGEETAQSLGIAVGRTRLIVLGLAALGTAAAVAVSGTIGFVGLVVPHALRLLVGSDYRVLLPASALGGATFVILADTVGRLIIQPAELRVGVVTALIGTPFFLVLLWRRRSRVGSW